MSQYPPPPPHGNFPPPQGFPPPQQGGFPPPNPGFGAPPGGAFAMPGPRTSVSAVISLICGILSCIPGVGLLAALFGIVGIAKTSKPNVSGRGLAIAGLILGLIGIAGWIAFGALGYGAYKELKAEMNRKAGPMVDSIAAGDFTKAREITTEDFPDAKFRTLQGQLQSLGKFQNFDIHFTKGFESKIVNNVKTTTMGGEMTFANGKREFTMTVIDKGGDPRVQDFQLK